MELKKLAIVGSGDLAQQIAYYATTDKQYDVVGFFDDFRKKNVKVNGIPVIGKLNEIENQFIKHEFDFLLIGIGYKHMNVRRKVFEQLTSKVPFGKLVHSSCLIDITAKIGPGTVIYPGCIIDQHVVLENNVLINIGNCIAHDTIINSHCFLSPRVAIAGFVTIGSACILGINATIIDNITICEGTQIGGAGVVIKDIDQSGLYVGNPVKFIRRI